VDCAANQVEADKQGAAPSASPVLQNAAAPAASSASKKLALLVTKTYNKLRLTGEFPNHYLRQLLSTAGQLEPTQS